MDDAEKRRLKKLGKQIVEQEFRERQARLAEANPAPIGSDEWAQNYKAQTLRERELRRSPPDRISAADAARDFVLSEVDPKSDFAAAPTLYAECPRCRDLLHTVAARSVACSCRSIQMNVQDGLFLVAPEMHLRFVLLIARGESGAAAGSTQSSADSVDGEHLATNGSTSSPVFFSEDDDPEMERAYENARAAFRYFWREVLWDRRRIVPALGLTGVKAPFSDDGDARRSGGGTGVEHMWLSNIDFDGLAVTGVLTNAPNWLTTIKQGDLLRVPLSRISDWMYVIGGEVFGAYTVNLLRSRMEPRERQEHDDAWGLDFGDPAKPRVAPEPLREGGFLKGLFGKRAADPKSIP